jgi:hypothetical protein
MKKPLPAASWLHLSRLPVQLCLSIAGHPAVHHCRYRARHPREGCCENARAGRYLYLFFIQMSVYPILVSAIVSGLARLIKARSAGGNLPRMRLCSLLYAHR